MLELKNDVYEIKARIGNHIAREDIALSPVGKILVNYFSLMFKDLYDFSDTLSNERRFELRNMLLKQESLPMTLIKVANPKKEKTLYEQLEEALPLFNSIEEALESYTKEYEALGSKYGKTGEDFWFEAESSNMHTEDYSRSMSLHKRIQMCHYLIEKNKNGLSSQED